MESYKIDFEIYDIETGETYDRQTMEVELTDGQIKEAAEVINDNGGIIPELTVFQNLFDYLIDECLMFYTEDFLDEDDEDFWKIYALDLGNTLPEDIRKAAEPLITCMTVDITYYKKGQEIGDSVACTLPLFAYKGMVEAARKPHPGMTDFEFLKKEY